MRFPVRTSTCALLRDAARWALLALLAAGTGARAQAPAARARLPEPLLGESLTDLDGVEAGELELDLTAAALGLRDGGRALRTSVEVEWRALPRLGLGVDLGLSGGQGGPPGVSAQVAASFSLLHEQALGLHLQAEGSLRVLEADESLEAADLGDAALPASLGLRGGLWLGPLALRTLLGLGLLGPSAHAVPLRAQAALLWPLGDGGRFGALGVEADGDWGLWSPLVLAPDLILDAGPWGLPLRLAVAVPWSPQARTGEAQLGLMVRLMLELDRD